MNGPCAVAAPRCGYSGPGVAGHHWLGCDADGEYVQPEIILSLCQPDCHQAGVHRLLQSAGLDGPMAATPGVLVGRIAVTLGWLAWDRSGEVTLPGEQLASVADVLGSQARIVRQGHDFACPSCGARWIIDESGLLLPPPPGWRK